MIFFKTQRLLAYMLEYIHACILMTLMQEMGMHLDQIQIRIDLIVCQFHNYKHYK